MEANRGVQRNGNNVYSTVSFKIACHCSTATIEVDSIVIDDKEHARKAA